MPKASTSNNGLVAGLDEVGLGALSGPMLIAVAAFPTGSIPIPGVNDSKKLTARKRESLFPVIMERASYVGFGWVHPLLIDQYGMSRCWQMAATEALKHAPSFDRLYVDGMRSVQGYRGNQSTEIKGDARIWQVGAASIIAKVARDRDMVDMARHYPGYKWESNKGYGSNAHWDRLREVGPCPYHRIRFLKKLNGSKK